MSSHHKKHSRDRAVTFSVLEEASSTSLRKGSVDLSSLSAMDYTWNNLSMATRDYLGKYCLGPTQPGDSVESRKETAEKKVSEVSNSSERSHSSVTSQGCTAPPCTPEPTNKDENDSQILDIMRLKKLPKLFWQTCSATACRWRTFLPCVVVVYQVLCHTGVRIHDIQRWGLFPLFSLWHSINPYMNDIVCKSFLRWRSFTTSLVSFAN